MNQPFMPQATPLYAVDWRNRVNMVVGWTLDTDEDPDCPKGVTWWEPVLVLIADYRPDGLVDTSCGARGGPQSIPADRDSDMPFTPSLEEARSIAAKWRQMDERDRRAQGAAGPS